MVTIGFVGLVLGFCEGLLPAKKSEFPRATAIETMLNSVIASPSLKYRIPFILSMPEYEVLAQMAGLQP